MLLLGSLFEDADANDSRDGHDQAERETRHKRRSEVLMELALALGSRHLLRDPIIALAVSVTTYLVFSRALGIGLPAGVLEGVL